MERHPVVVGLGYGDEGKGSVVDWLVRDRNAHAVVRFNGGAQAAHNVVLPDGRHHTFAQFGSGTFVPGVRTHLSRFMMVNPLNLHEENEHLVELGVTDALERLTIDEHALITTPIHVAANQAREKKRGGSRHGSCGQGIGETAGFALHQGDKALRASHLTSPDAIRVRLRALEQYYTGAGFKFQTLKLDEMIDLLLDAGRALNIATGGFLRSLLNTGPCVFEGAQGVLLDETYGFHPYTTWSTTTFKNAETLLEEMGHGAAERVGVLRAYSTRHGAGPFPVEDESLRDRFPEDHNGQNEWQGAWRVGLFDTVMAEYANGVAGGCDWIALTHYDRTDRGAIQVSTRHREPFVKKEVISLFHLTAPDQSEQRTALVSRLRAAGECEVDILEHIEHHLDTPVGLVSSGPTHLDKEALELAEFSA